MVKVLLMVTSAHTFMLFDGDIDLPSDGVRGGFDDGVWGYCLPFVKPGWVAHRLIVRFAVGEDATIELLDLEAKGPELKGFNGGFRDTDWGYLVPYMNDPGYARGKVVRFSLRDLADVEVLDLRVTEPRASGLTAASRLALGAMPFRTSSAWQSVSICRASRSCKPWTCTR